MTMRELMAMPEQSGKNILKRRTAWQLHLWFYSEYVDEEGVPFSAWPGWVKELWEKKDPDGFALFAKKLEKLGALCDQAITAAFLSRMTMEDFYKYCLEEEKEREIQYAERTNQGRFEASFAHFDALENDEDLDDEKNPYLSDEGAFVEMLECFDNPLEAEQAKAFERARKKILRSIPECWPTMKRIFKNGKDRYVSICKGTLENMQLANKSTRRSSRGRYAKRGNFKHRK